MKKLKSASNADYLFVSGASKVLKCSEDQVRRLVKLGRLPAIRLDNGTRVFLRSDLLKFCRT